MKYLLRFNDETEMLETLLSVGAAEETLDPGRPISIVPQAPCGTIDVRGALGTPGQYVDSGEVDENGDIIWTEVVPGVVWPGYHCVLTADEVIDPLMAYVVDGEWAG